MKRRGLLVAFAVVIVADAFVFVRASRNRSGPVDSEIELTEREVPFIGGRKDDSSVTLSLTASFAWDGDPILGPDKLSAMGFDTSVPATDSRASRHYGRMLPRPAYAAWEYDGPGFQGYLTWFRDRQRPVYRPAEHERPEWASRLVAIDAGPDPALLRSQHPDRARVMILPCVVRARHELAYAGPLPAKPARIYGQIQNIEIREIHVPAPLSSRFHNMLPRSVANEPRYKVTLRVGAGYEPWVVAIR